MNIIKKLITYNTVFIIITGLIFYYLFSFSLYNLAIFLAGLLTISFSYKFFRERIIYFNAMQLFIGAIFVWVFNDNILFITLFLIGANISIYYYQLINLRKPVNHIALLNVISLVGIIFISGIEKFRGYNKLNIDDIYITIPLIILINLAVYFLISGAYSKIISKTKNGRRQQKLFISAILISIGYYFVSFTIYKEVGTDKILIPLIVGLFAAILDIAVKPKNAITNIIEIVLLILIPFQISGLVGISLAFLGNILFIDILGNNYYEKKSTISNTIYKLTPILFLLAASEIRENKGVITRFNMVSGYVLAWIYISTLIIGYSGSYISKLKSILRKNEIPGAISIIVVLFTTIALTLIIKVGRDEALITLLIISVVYTYLVSLLDHKRYVSKARFVAGLAGVIGSLSFLILTGF